MEGNAQLMNKFYSICANVVGVDHEGRRYRVYLDRFGMHVVKLQVRGRHGDLMMRVAGRARADMIRQLVAEAGIKHQEFKS